jgi:hypothetical protein
MLILTLLRLTHALDDSALDDSALDSQLLPSGCTGGEML